MSYNVKIEKHSVSPADVELVSFVIQMPRVVLAEIVTHRLNSETWNNDISLCERTATPDISKNSASSRAIPFERMVKKVMDDPYMPMWTLQQKGMQGKAMDDKKVIEEANSQWLQARGDMIHYARYLHDTLGIHKQDCNRLLEPWQWVTQIVTSSQWDNFFALRCHEKAFPPFRKLARMMYLAKKISNPVKLNVNEWHLPFVNEPLEWIPKAVSIAGDLPNLVKFSAARCAWLSYENHEKDGSEEALLRTFDSLFKEPPIHGSPLEHQGTPNTKFGSWYEGNLNGYIQARKLVKGEKTLKYEPTNEEVASWGDL